MVACMFRALGVLGVLATLLLSTGCPIRTPRQGAYLNLGRLDAAQPLSGPQYLIAGHPSASSLVRADQPDASAWTDLLVPGPDTIYDVSVAPLQTDTLYTVGESYDGEDFVLKSDDRGQSWLRLLNGLPNPLSGDGAPTLVRVDPFVANRVWVGYSVTAGVTSFSRLNRSDDGGQTWAPVTSGVVGNPVRQLVFDTTDPNLRYLHTDQVLRSIDGGGSWQPFAAGLNVFPEELVADPSVSGRIYARTRAGLWVSNAGGAWSDIPGAAAYTTTTLEGPATSAFAVDPVDPQRLYLGVSGRGVHTSADGGATWTELPGAQTSGLSVSILTPLQFRIDSANSQRIFVVHESGLVLSDDGGASWRELGTTGIPRSVTFY
jgi:hypothetical protein